MLSKDFCIWSESFERGWVKRKSLIWSAVLQLQDCHWEQREGQKVKVSEEGCTMALPCCLAAGQAATDPCSCLPCSE